MKRIRVFEVGSIDSVGSTAEESQMTYVGDIPISREPGVWNGLADMHNIEGLAQAPSSDTLYREHRGRYKVFVRSD